MSNGSLLSTFIISTYEPDTPIGTPVQISIDRNSPQWRNPILALILICVCLLTISGNVLVVVAVCTKRYLRNPTGYLIVSLAFADLIVGLVVMPLNSLFEMSRHVWLLGLTMCDIFHALDILASTSSIWNLCVISLDRYMAGQDPIGYRDKVSKRRITLAIVFVWVMSACLSFPAIIWWRKTSPHLYHDQSQCLFTDNWLYVAFSSLVSFYIPMILILFAYGRVFLIATRHSKQMKCGVKKVKNANWRRGSEGGLLDDTAATLRIHFGRSRQGRNSAIANVIMAANGTAVSTQCQRVSKFRALPNRAAAENDGCFSSEETTPRTSRSQQNRIRKNDSERSVNRNSPASHHPLLQSERNSTDSRNSPFRRTKQSTISSTTSSNHQNGNPQIITNAEEQPDSPPQNPSMVTLANRDENTTDVTTCLLPNGQQLAFKKKTGMREKSRQMMKYVHEQRAARTLSIIVGAFIICWLPFFIVSPFMAICSGCVDNQEVVFSVITWAGHLNSMLNPLIYSRFSRDFRKAFKQILTCQREKPTRQAIKTPLNLVFAQLVSITQLWEQPDGQLSTA